MMALDPDDRDFRRRQRARNIAIGLALGALVVIFYVLTFVKMGAQH